jgi:hypothetical protein
VDGNGVRVFRRNDNGSTYYRGLMICANLWACSVCSAKISERRREELEKAISLVLDNGGGVYHMLLTIPHNLKCKAEDRTAKNLLGSLLKAYDRLCAGKYRLSVLVPGYMGSVRSLEVTHGENGWHPHLHVLVFTDAVLDDKALDLAHFKVWGKWEARVHGLMGSSPSRKAFSFAPAVRGSFQAGELEHVCPVTGYVTKFGADHQLQKIVEDRRRWGAADELTKGHLKTAGRGGRSPWQLLADYQGGDLQAGMLWREFVEAFKGRAQLCWSRGLRAELGLDDEQSDEQLAAAVRADDPLAARISDEDWDFIWKHNLRGQVLEELRLGDWSDVRRLLESLGSGGRSAVRDERSTPTAGAA